MTGKWELNGDTCPKCDKPTENLVTRVQREEDTSPHVYVLAERCAKCGWVIKFDD